MRGYRSVPGKRFAGGFIPLSTSLGKPVADPCPTRAEAFHAKGAENQKCKRASHDRPPPVKEGAGRDRRSSQNVPYETGRAKKKTHIMYIFAAARRKRQRETRPHAHTHTQQTHIRVCSYALTCLKTFSKHDTDVERPFVALNLQQISNIKTKQDRERVSKQTNTQHARTRNERFATCLRGDRIGPP